MRDINSELQDRTDKEIGPREHLVKINIQNSGIAFSWQQFTRKECQERVVVEDERITVFMSSRTLSTRTTLQNITIYRNIRGENQLVLC